MTLSSLCDTPCKTIYECIKALGGTSTQYMGFDSSGYPIPKDFSTITAYTPQVRNGLTYTNPYIELGGTLYKHTDIYQATYGMNLNVAGDSNVIIGAKSTDADYATYDDLGLLGLLNRAKTDGSVSRFALIQMVNQDTRTQRGIYAFFRNPSNYKQVLLEFDTLGGVTTTGTAVASIDTSNPFSGNNCLRITGGATGNLINIPFALNTGTVAPNGQLYFMLNGSSTVTVPSAPPVITGFTVRVLAPDTSNCVTWTKSLEVMGSNLWTGILLNTTGVGAGVSTGSPNYTNITGIQIQLGSNVSSWIDIDKLEWFALGQTNQFIRQTYVGGERVYGEYMEVHPLCDGLKGEYGFGGEGRPGYQSTLALANAHSLKARNFIYQSAYIDARIYGNQIGIRLHVNKEGQDTLNTNPAYFNKFYSSIHQEAILVYNDASKQVSPFKFFNRATITNPIQATNYQNSNDSVYTFFDNGTNNTVDTARVIRGTNQSFGAALAIHQGTVNKDGVNVFEAWQVNSSASRRGLIMRSDGRVVINALWSSNTVNGSNTDQTHGTNKPFGLLHVHGMIGGNSGYEPANFTVNRGHFMSEVALSTGTKTITLPAVNTMFTAPLLYFWKDSNIALNLLIIQTTGGDKISVNGVLGTSYTLSSSSVGAFVTLIAGKWKVHEIFAGGTLV